MIECVFSPGVNHAEGRLVLTEDKLGLFGSALNLSKCEAELRKRTLERSDKLIELDHETCCIENHDNFDFTVGTFHSGGESSMRVFVEGLIEYDRFHESLKGVDLAKSVTIQSLLSDLVPVLSFLSSELRKGFSFLIYAVIKEERFLIFGRDRFGESSLLLSAGSMGREIIISNIESDILSFQEDPQSIEIPTTGLFLLNLSSLEFEFHSWSVNPPYLDPGYWSNFGHQTLESLEEDSVKLLDSLRLVFGREMEKRLTIEVFEDRAFIYMGVLFSGGLDSTVLLYLLLEWLFSNFEHLEDTVVHKYFSGGDLTSGQFKKDNLFFVVELINASFAPAEAPDRLTGLSSYYEILELFREHFDTYKNVSIRFICVDNPGDSLTKEEKKILKCIAPCRTHLDFNIGGALFFALGGKGRLVDKQSFRGEWWQEIVSEMDSSTVWEGIFEKKNPFPEADIEISKANSVKQHSDDPNTPRKCPYCSFREHSKCQNKCCKSCCRKIQQKLIEPKGESFQACRIHKMKTADYSKIPSTQRSIYPYNYYLSDSRICQALFPEERELVKDLITCENGELLYNSRSRFLIIGSGADEFLGGYGRHITAKKHNGSEGIRREMLFDINRLWIRNLGRDYRLAMFNHRSLFAIFLQNSVTKLIGDLNFENICGSRFEVTKPLLRFVAGKLGIKFSARFKKRAVQFGTRSSRQTNLKHFDSHRKATADATYIPTNI
ncbi:asparagine synthetase B like [Cryptosporidium canis]|uniref:Asparagine synthetase B like n=1 Tax=Cryptosporidium canis TaxID=195482 RepID=A0ABQ8P4A9_9CRYT|nr:asparagine synthetase B like [Cryptosporidium canis]